MVVPFIDATISNLPTYVNINKHKKTTTQEAMKTWMVVSTKRVCRRLVVTTNCPQQVG